MDVFVGNSTTGNDQLYLNDGIANFSLTATSFGASTTWDASVGDVNGDGHLDILTANTTGTSSPAPDKVWLGDGTGFFSAAPSVGNQFTFGMDLGDIDGDGDLDAVYTGNPAAGFNDYVALNDGAGVFTLTGQDHGVSIGVDVALADMDGDLDLDAVYSTNPGANLVFYNNNVSSIDFNPVNDTVCEGFGALFNVGTSGSVDSVRWHQSTDGGGTFTPITVSGSSFIGVKSETLTIDPVDFFSQ